MIPKKALTTKPIKPCRPLKTHSYPPQLITFRPSSQSLNCKTTFINQKTWWMIYLGFKNKGTFTTQSSQTRKSQMHNSKKHLINLSSFLRKCSYKYPLRTFSTIGWMKRKIMKMTTTLVSRTWLPPRWLKTCRTKILIEHHPLYYKTVWIKIYTKSCRRLLNNL